MVATTDPAPKPTKPFTGRHMFAILCAFFGVVIAVNVTMARLAARTFGGEVVENSYVASQKFNRWLDEAKAEKALGWSAATSRASGNRVAVVLSGVPGSDARVAAVARHPLGLAADIPLTFTVQSDGRFISAEPLPAGRWALRIEIDAAGRHISTEAEVR